MMGADALVPPNTSHPETPPYGVESYTATPVFGSATAETSAVALFEQPVLRCHRFWFVAYFEQPDPAPLQAVSRQPRAVLVSLNNDVPPTATTVGKAAG